MVGYVRSEAAVDLRNVRADYSMNLQISIFGLLIAAALYGVCGSVLWAIWRKARGQTWAKIVLPVLAMAVLVAPWADEVWIAWHFNEFCKDAGVRVMRRVEAEGYYDATTTGWSKPEIVTDHELIDSFERSGFRFRERNTSGTGNSHGGISHLEKYPDGTWRITILDRPEARYHYKRIVDFRDARGIHHEAPVALNIMMTGEIVVDSMSGELLGRNAQYSRRPGWLEGSWTQFFGSGAIVCKGSVPNSSGLRESLHHYVLIPVARH